MSRVLAALCGAGLLFHATTTALTQGRPLAVTSATPVGEVAQIVDAGEIRIAFSEPMIDIGGPVTGAPAWFSIEPAVGANFYWSGTRTLIASIAPDRPLPYATRFTVRIDASARSAAGRVLGAPYSFTFVTPTVRLLSADWYRKTGRFDSQAVIALRFNQPVRAVDVAAHAQVRHTPHEWRTPEVDGEAQGRLEREDPEAWARFRNKVDAVRRVASSTDPVPVRAASEWDERRFPRAPHVAVIETIAAPPPEAWLTVTLDDQLPGAEGPEKHASQQTLIRLEPAFFVDANRCNPWCDPAGSYGVRFRRGIDFDAFERTLTVRDISNGGAGREVARRSDKPLPLPYRPPDGYTYLNPQNAGYERQAPATKWLLRIDSDLRATDGQPLGYTWMAVVDNGHERPYAGWAGQVWEARNGPQVPFLARNVVDGHRWLQPIVPAELMPLLQALRRPNAPLPSRSSSNQRLEGTIDAAEGHRIDLRDSLSTRGFGLVYAAVRAQSVRPRSMHDFRGIHQPTVLQVTNLGLTVKDSPQSTLVFVTRLDNAEPVATANITIVDANNQPLWTGATNQDGIALAPALPLRQINNPFLLSYVVTVEKDGDIAWVGSDWTGDVHPSSFGFRYQLAESRNLLRGSLFTDRGVYKQGEEIKVKGVLRGDTPTGMRVIPEGAAAEIVVRDARGTEVDRRTVPVNRWSSIEWSWRVPDAGSLGTYSIGVNVPKLFPDRGVTGSFLVAAFRRPDFRVDATVDTAVPVLGTALRGRLEARYLFGAPIGARPVRWWVNRDRVLNVPAAIRERYPEQQFVFGYMPRPEPTASPIRRPSQDTTYGRVLENTGSLDRDGRLEVEVPTKPGEDTASSYRFEGDVESVSGQRIANRAAVVVHPASFYVGISRPPFFAEVQKGLSTAIVAADLNGAARANVPVTVTLVREQWTSDRSRENAGSATWSRTETTVGEWKVTTSTDRVPLTIPLREGGCYILRAVARDEQGRPTRTETMFYALGRGISAWRSEGNRIDLTPERTTWSPGQTARILVQSPWERATALVTVEREGIRRHQRVAITSMQDAIDVPIADEDIPNVYVSVLLVKGRTGDAAELKLGATYAGEEDPGKPAFRVGYVELTVDDASRRLKVEVSADREEYRPRQEAKVAVAVNDARDRPRASEVTLWAMDHGLLSLTNYRVPDVARAIYARKALQVLTQDNRARLIGRRNTIGRQTVEQLQQANTGAGGGGRGGQGQGFASALAPPPPPPAFRAAAESIEEAQPEEIRADFRPLVFWLGSVTTDANGRASTTVTLPDSLTTYRIMAVAGDLTSHFGAGDSEIRATKPLTMLPAFPRFLARGDRASFGGVVTNGTGAAGDAIVTIESTDSALVDFGTDARRTVRITPGESVPVRFDAVSRGAGRVTVRMRVALGAEVDAFEMPLDVIAPARLETVAAYGDTTASAVEKLTIPAGALPGAGGLTVSLASTALVGLGESARYVDEYPHRCAEPIASRALVLLLSASLDGVFGAGGGKSEDQRAAGIKALNQLYAFQCGDGGFKMWSGPCPLRSNPYLTAYILHVMHIASSLSVTTDRGAVGRGLDFLSSELQSTPREVQLLPAWSATQAYAVKVLAEHNRLQRGQIDRLYEHAERMPVFALSYLADALHASGSRSVPRYADIVRRIGNALRVDADRAHVEEQDDPSLVWLWNSNVRATAVTLSGLARRGDDNSLFAPMVRWLLAARTNGRWGTTQENAVALEALVRYYQAMETETPKMSATVALGGSAIGTASFVGRSTTAEQVHLTMPELLRDAAAGATRDLVVSRQGTGRLFYTARLQYLTPQSADPVDRGMRIERRYQRVDSGEPAAAGTSFSSGDLVRVTLTVTLPHEGRFLAFTDPLPAGFEAVDAVLATTATDVGAVATTQSSDGDRFAWWRRGGFDHVEKHDDRVVAYATRLSTGRHELTYLVRATTSGTFSVPGTWGEAIYAPEITGRSAAAAVTVR